MMPEPYGNTFDWYNNQHTQPGTQMAGRVVGYGDGHRLDVYLPLFNQIIHNVRMGTRWHAGPKTGEFALPPIGAEVQIAPKLGKSAGLGQMEVISVNFSGDWPEPDHPSMKDLKNFYFKQGAVVVGDNVTPGTVELLDDQGGKHELVMGKRVRRGRGLSDERDDGLSITHAENEMMDASNTTALAQMKASMLDPSSDMTMLAKGLQDVSTTMQEANRATSSAAMAFGGQITAQAKAVAVGNNAEALSLGQALPDGF